MCHLNPSACRSFWNKFASQSEAAVRQQTPGSIVVSKHHNTWKIKSSLQHLPPRALKNWTPASMSSSTLSSLIGPQEKTRCCGVVVVFFWGGGVLVENTWNKLMSGFVKGQSNILVTSLRSHSDPVGLREELFCPRAVCSCTQAAINCSHLFPAPAFLEMRQKKEKI